MVMLVSWRIDRALVALLVVAGLSGAAFDSWAQQQEPPKRAPTQKPPAKPAQKPGQATSKPAAKTDPAQTETLAPSQIGVPTPAQFAYMVDPQTSTVLLFKDADKPMHPSSMAKMMTVYILFEELTAGRLKLDSRFPVSEKAWRMSRQGSTRWVGDTGT